MKKALFSLMSAAAILALLLPAAGNDKKEEGEWIQLFNGKDLDGWTPKIRYQEFGDDPAHTFRVEDGVLKVAYDGDSSPKATQSSFEKWNC